MTTATATPPPGEGIHRLRPSAWRRWAAAPTREGFLAPVAIALAFLVLLAAFAAVDPAHGVTASTSPYTDEGWNVSNARDLVMFGRWATDAWQMWLVNMPYSVLQAAWLSVAGIGIVQARLLDIGFGAAALAALGIGLRRPLGPLGAAVATAGLAGSALFLYYGRLAYLEPLVVLWLIVAELALAREHPSIAAGVVAGLAVALAVATKASAVAAAGGLLAGVAVAGAGDPAVRRALGAAVASALLMAIAWAIIFALPHAAALATDLRIWATEPPPHGLDQLVTRIVTYAARSDGAIPLALPLLVAGAAGALLALARYSRLDPVRRRVALGSMGWFAAGMAVLLVVPYRPNRYVVPLLPPLAILAGLGFAILLDWVRRAPGRGGVASVRGAGQAADAAPAGGDASARAPTGVAAALAAAVVALLLAVPGLALDAGWMANTPSTLPQIQAEVAAIVPPGSTVQGDLAPILAMRARAVTIVSRPATNVNAGDLYATRDVRWVLTNGPAPRWATLHEAAWAARTRELCVSWGPGTTCLYRLP